MSQRVEKALPTNRYAFAAKRALEDKDYERLKTLISLDEVNIKAHGFTYSTALLHMAVEADDLEGAKILLDAGSNINVCDLDGNMPINVVASEQMQALL